MLVVGGGGDSGGNGGRKRGEGVINCGPSLEGSDAEQTLPSIGAVTSSLFIKQLASCVSSFSVFFSPSAYNEHIMGRSVGSDDSSPKSLEENI
jgi:hypothetical protein